MTLVSDIIRDAYRENNLIALAATPSTAETTEALRLLNRVFSGVFGDEMGENFCEVPIGRANIERPSGYPWYGTTPYNDWFVPDNTRLVLNTTEELELFLSPSPQDGARISVIDPNTGLVTNNLILNANGRTIETTPTVTITEGPSEWFYRADLGNWQLISALVANDPWPFPEKFDDLFIVSLGMRLSTRNAQPIDPMSIEAYRRGLRQFRARYRQRKQMNSELGLYKLSLTKDTSDLGGDIGNSLFDAGRPYP